MAHKTIDLTTELRGPFVKYNIMGAKVTSGCCVFGMSSNVFGQNSNECGMVTTHLGMKHVW
jgi:hypothetical protein